MREILETKNSVLFCPRNKKTGQYVTERYELTDDIFEAIGWKTKKQCREDIENMDEPYEWEIVVKITNMMIVK